MKVKVLSERLARKLGVEVGKTADVEPESRALGYIKQGDAGAVKKRKRTTAKKSKETR